MDLIPIDGEVAIADTFVPSAEKKKHIERLTNTSRLVAASKPSRNCSLAKSTWFLRERCCRWNRPRNESLMPKSWQATISITRPIWPKGGRRRDRH